MPERIKVIFRLVHVNHDADLVGNGEFYFIASVDGAPVGDRNRIFTAVEGRFITLPQPQWSHIVDVRNKTEVRARFQGKEEDAVVDEDLGTVEHVLRPPWRQIGFITRRTHYYILQISVELEVRGQFGQHAPLEVFACRQHAGSYQCSTVSGTPVRHRLEICPVMPVPSDAVLPPRPAFPPGTQGVQNVSGVIFLAETSPINTIPNPAVIPILEHPLATPQTAAQIQITYYYPDSLRFQDNDERLVWNYSPIAGNPQLGFVALPGEQPGRGLTAWVYGVGNQEGEVLLEVRYQGALLATHRALVRRMRRVRCRFNILNATSGPSPRSTPQHALNHLRVADIILRQMGLELELDPDLTPWDNAVISRESRGIFRIRVSPGITRNVDWSVNNGFIRATELNYNRNDPHVVNIAYIRSVRTIQGHHPIGLCTDLAANGAGASISESGTPSTSWVRPSGVLPDGAAGTVTMTLFNPARQRNPNMVAFWIRNDFADPDDSDSYGRVIAHELGHVLGLRHRGQGVQGGQRIERHPPIENRMFGDDDTFGLDLDMIQSKAVHRSPVVR